MKKYKKFDKEKRKFCKYELDKIKEDQRGFVRKVYGIFLSMCIVTFIPIMLVAFGQLEVGPIPTTNDDGVEIETSDYGIHLSVFVAFLMIMLLACTYFPCNSRKSERIYLHRYAPFNYIFLYTFTLAVSYLLCRLVKRTMTKEGEEEGTLIVLQSISMTVALAIGLTMFACIHQDEFNLTSFTPYIYVLSFATASTGLMMVAVKSMDTDLEMGFDIQFVYCLVGVILFSMFLMYDTQMIIGGQAAFYKFDLESYVLGGLALYIDIMNIFAIMLQMFSAE